MSKPRKIGPDTGKPAGNRGKGRPKGAKNKTTKALKDMILGALEDAGGQSYLVEQAEANPGAFMTLIGKVLPMDIKAAVAHTLTSRTVEIPEGD